MENVHFVYESADKYIFLLLMFLKQSRITYVVFIV